MSLQFAVCLITLLFFAGIGTPIGYSTLLAAIAYLTVGGMDIALAAEQALSGLYDSFIILAVPLFIVAANIMNAGTISDRLLAFCVSWQFPEKTARCAGMTGNTTLVYFIKQCVFITVHQNFYNFLQMTGAFTFFPESIT